MYNSQYYTCEQIDQRLLQGYLDDYNTQNNTNLTKAEFLTLLFNTIGRNNTVDNLVTQIGYYECDTAGATAAKAITVANYALFAGGSMKVKFINKNTADNATLNINNQGAKALYYQGERASSTNYWDEGEVVEIYYDGTNYYANNVKGGSGPTVLFSELDNFKNATLRDGSTPTRYTVIDNEINRRKMGTLDVISDGFNHVVTQIFTTHQTYDDATGAISSGSHHDDIAVCVYRSVKISGGTLPDTNWTRWNYINDEILKGIKGGLEYMSFKEGVFNVSLYNADGDTPATYETLTLALAAVPSKYQDGGMSIKFILRTNTGTEEEPVYKDDYVQYRLMAAAWSNDESDWQGIDDEPTAGSDNLVKSGGVAAKAQIYDSVIDSQLSVNLFDKTKAINGYVSRSNGNIVSTSNSYFTTDYIPIDSEGVYAPLALTGGSYWGFACYDSDKNYTHGTVSKQALYQDGDAYVRFSGNRSNIDRFMVVKGTSSDVPDSYQPYGNIGILKDDTVGNSQLQKDSVEDDNVVSVAAAKVNSLKVFSGSDDYSTNWNNIIKGLWFDKEAIIAEYPSFKIIEKAHIINARLFIAYITLEDSATTIRIQTEFKKEGGVFRIHGYSSNFRSTYGYIVTGTYDDILYTGQPKNLTQGNYMYDINLQPLLCSMLNDRKILLYEQNYIKTAAGKNLCNPLDENFKLNCYINSTNGIEYSTTDNVGCTGFIPVSSNGLVINHPSYYGTVAGLAVYNQKKVYIRGLRGGVYSYEDGDVYVRFTFNYDYRNEIQVEEGSTPTAFEPYNPVAGFGIKNSEQDYDKFDVFLPNKLYAVRGDVLQLFYQGMAKVVNPENYNYLVSCNRGKQFHRYFEYDCPSDAVLGNVNFTINIKDNNRKSLGSANSIITVVKAPISPTNNLNVLCVGDSVTAGGIWPAEFYRRLTGSGGSPTGAGLANISFVGRYVKNDANFEGRSGYAWSDYSTRGRAAFRFAISENTNVAIGDVYSNNGFQYTVIEVSDNNTIRCSTSSFSNIPAASGVLTKVSGSGDATITFTSSSEDSQNPFWDANNNKLSFSNYATRYCNGSIDVLYVMLGANGLFADPTQYIKDFIDAFHTDFPNGKVKIMGMYIPSMKLMMPGYGASGSQYADTYNVICKLKDQGKLYQEIADLSEYSSFVEYVDVACQLDSDYNFPMTQKDVNTRNSSYQEPYANNTIHASPTSGYLQIADAAYRNFVASFCQ